jgi:hypothetical protein
VLEARSRGIGVTGAVIGRELKPKEMTHMFGPPKYWRQLGRHFRDDLIELVSQSFLEYLRVG